MLKSIYRPPNPPKGGQILSILTNSLRKLNLSPFRGTATKRQGVLHAEQNSF